MRKLAVVFVLLFSVLFFNVPTDAASSQLIIINKKTNTLAFYNAGSLVRTYSVATGRSRDLTPEGTFKIVNKIVNRPYYKDKIPGGDPRNPLGNRWMGLEARGTYGTTYGIHGNNNESSIGKYISSGCVRMHNAEVRQLFDQVQLYTPVVITWSDSSFDQIARANGFSVANSNGWIWTNAGWYYYANGVAQTGWVYTGGQWYYLDSNGLMKTGWVLDKGTWYYLESSGAMKTGWLLNKGKWYFLQNSGAMKTGWLANGGKWYFLDNSGAMKTGWALDKGTWYYLENSGAMKTGWVLDKGAWYYLENSGAMATGWANVSGQRYYLKGDGAMATGWLQLDNKWYYLNPSGSMAKNTVVNGYIIGEDGVWVQVEYVALGDSLASGMTPEGIDRDPVNGVDPDWGYPNYIAENFGKSYHLLDFKNFGVKGYKTTDVMAQLNKPDVQKEIKKATHITVGIGANDLLEVLPAIQANPEIAPIEIGKIALNLSQILAKIDELNPKAKVYVMGYYNPYPYLPQEEQAQLLPLLTGLNGQIQAQAKQHGDTFVPTADVIASKYQEYLPNPQNIHLSLTGYQAIAGEFWKVMK